MFFILFQCIYKFYIDSNFQITAMQKTYFDQQIVKSLCCNFRKGSCAHPYPSVRNSNGIVFISSKWKNKVCPIRMFCSFYWYLPMIKSLPTGYRNFTTSLPCAMVNVVTGCVSLQHCSYIINEKCNILFVSILIENFPWYWIPSNSMVFNNVENVLIKINTN